MKLVTFQSMKALKELYSKGYLECNPEFIELNKMGITYNFITSKMAKYMKSGSVKYPIWCWVKFKNGICPPKKKGTKIVGFDVKITFNKNIEDVFITDYRRYSFLLSNQYIANDLEDKKQFDKLLVKYNITKEDLLAYVRKDKYSTHRMDKGYLEVCDMIYKSFDKCITDDSNVLQGCVYKIYLNEIESIEILEDGYIQGSFNYIRSNGKRHDWIKEYNNKLK